MRIGINGRFLVANQTGVQRVAYNLLRSLILLDRENEYILFTGRSQIGNPDWDFPNVKLVASSIKAGNNLRNHWWEQVTLPKLAKRHEVDILHSPANMAPLFYRGASIVHIHDLCFVVNPQWYSYLFHSVYNFVIPRLARKATRVITNSNNSRNDLLQFCDIPAEKVSLIYWAVDESFTPLPEVLPENGVDIPKEGFILYVGSLEPRKNISTLVEAFEHLRSENPQLKTKLILIGGESPLFADVRLKIKKFREDVIFKGFVEDVALREYYRQATVVAYPSLYEGFGLPPLEAMASGAAVVTSITSSIPEVVGDAALMVSPYDYQQLSDALSKVILDKNLREHLQKAGLKQVKRFNWTRVARNVIAVYYEVGRIKGVKSGSQEAEKGLTFKQWKKLSLTESQSENSL